MSNITLPILRSQARALMEKKAIRAKLDPRSLKAFERDIEFRQRAKVQNILNTLLQIKNDDDIGVVSKAKVTMKSIKPKKVVKQFVKKVVEKDDALFVHGTATVRVHYQGSKLVPKEFQIKIVVPKKSSKGLIEDKIKEELILSGCIKDETYNGYKIMSIDKYNYISQAEFMQSGPTVQTIQRIEQIGMKHTVFPEIDNAQVENTNLKKTCVSMEH